MILVPCFFHPCGKDGHMVVFRHRRKGSVDIRLVVGGVGHCRFQIVRHEVLGAASIELEGPDRAVDEVLDSLIGDGPREEIRACPEHRDEEFRFDDLPRCRILVVGLVPGEVDEHLLSCLVGEPHDGIHLLCPFTIQFIEPASLVAVGVLLLILLVEKQERYARPCHLLREVLEIGQRLCRRSLLFVGEQELLQFAVAHDGDFPVGDIELLEPVHIGMGGRRRDVACPRNGSDTQVELQQQPCCFLQFSHGYSPPFLLHLPSVVIKEGSVAWGPGRKRNSDLTRTLIPLKGRKVFGKERNYRSGIIGIGVRQRSELVFEKERILHILFDGSARIR